MTTHEDWIKAGKLAAEVRDFGANLIKPGASYKEVTLAVEKKIAELGAIPAFPPQIALNDTAAHFTVDPDEDITFSDQVASIDVGVCVNGAIGDTARTIDLSGEHADLVNASRDALNQAIRLMENGVLRLGEIGKMIADTTQSHGFKPVRNLSGHGLGAYEIHKAPTIPNYNNGDLTEIQPGSYIAIEPFASAGAGMIFESDGSNIFTLMHKKPVRSPITRQVLKEIEKFQGLPFTTRWLAQKMPIFKVNFGLKELLLNGSLQSHPPLIDKHRGLVSQAEHSVHIDEDRKVTVLTRND